MTGVTGGGDAAMPLGAQPRRARGTVGQPYSALNIRMVLAAIGWLLATVVSVLPFQDGFAPCPLTVAETTLIPPPNSSVSVRL